MTFKLLFLVACSLSLVFGNHINLARIYARHQREIENAPTTQQVQVESFIFNQTLDHFVPRSQLSYFNQRYYVNSTFHQPNGPAFLIIGGESAESPSAVLSGAVVEAAEKYGAILFALEHRFYGESVPFPELTPAALQYLTVEQALADLVNFQQYAGPQFNLSENTKWAVFGCSYSGALAAWYRLKFPHLAISALAGSSPVEAVLSFYQYDEVISQSLGPECAASIHNATLAIQAVIENPVTKQSIKEKLGCANITDDVAVLYVLADTVAFAVQYSRNVNESCASFLNSTDLVNTYVEFVHNIYSISGSTCYDFDISGFTNETVDPNSMMRQWMWQSCNELGYFQTAPAINPLRSTNITVEWHLSVCEKLFSGSSNEPRVDWFNSEFGGDSLQTSNTIFTNGLLDPWKALSVTTPLSASVPSLLIAGQAHCANWRGFRPTDPQPLVSARNEAAAYVGAFLDACDNATNNTGCGANGFCSYQAGTNSTVQAVCVCTAGFSGSSCIETASSDGKSVPWWSLLVLGLGVAVVFALAGIYVGNSYSRRTKYHSVRS